MPLSASLCAVLALQRNTDHVAITKQIEVLGDKLRQEGAADRQMLFVVCGVARLPGCSCMGRWIQEAHPLLRRNFEGVNGPLMEKLANLCYFHDKECIALIRGSQLVSCARVGLAC